MQLTVETKVWEADWQAGVLGGRIEQFFSLIPTRAIRRLLINNVKNPTLVFSESKRLKDAGIVDEVLLVSDHLPEALRHFRLNAENLGRGLPYSSAELVGLYTCRTPFLCHFAGDCRMGHQSDWIGRGIELLTYRRDVSVVNPIWNCNYPEVILESKVLEGNYAFGNGFSDQCYLVRTDELLNADLIPLHPASDRYPKYGGDLFEKRVDSWMLFSGRTRATDLTATYIHFG